MTIARIKGSAFREFVRWYCENHGPAALEAASRALPPETRDLLDPQRDGFGILPSAWYPAPIVHAIFDAAIAGRSPRERADLARAGARATLDRTLRGVYGVLFAALATPERYARFAQRLWSSYYDTGVLVIERSVPGKAQSRIRDWDAHHRFLCDMHQHAAVFIYEAMGLRVVGTTRLECVSTGGTACRFETTWVVPPG